MYITYHDEWFQTIPHHGGEQNVNMAKNEEAKALTTTRKLIFPEVKPAEVKQRPLNMAFIFAKLH